MRCALRLTRTIELSQLRQRFGLVPTPVRAGSDWKCVLASGTDRPLRLILIRTTNSSFPDSAKSVVTRRHTFAQHQVETPLEPVLTNCCRQTAPRVHGACAIPKRDKGRPASLARRPNFSFGYLKINNRQFAATTPARVALSSSAIRALNEATSVAISSGW